MCSISNPSALIYNYFDISLISTPTSLLLPYLPSPHPPPCFSHISPLHTYHKLRRTRTYI